MFGLFTCVDNHREPGLAAQKALLDKHVQNEYNVKTVDGHNVVEFISPKSINSEGQKKTLVLMHGFGNGLGFFYRNYDSLLTVYDRILAIDWLGMGNSSRKGQKIRKPSMYEFLFNDRTQDAAISVEVATQFIDGLHNVLALLEVGEFTLAGHSLGGYLVGRYAIKYPEKIISLILISPAGIPVQPPNESLVTSAEMNWKMRSVLHLYNLSWTPQDIVRLTGKRDWVKSYFSRRFPGQWIDREAEFEMVVDYVYCLTVAPGNGEYALSTILEPVQYKVQAADAPTPEVKTGVFGRVPLEYDLTHFKKPILLMYGDDDWLSFGRARQVAEAWASSGSPLTRFAKLKSAGHYLFFDQPEEFLDLIQVWETQVESVHGKNHNITLNVTQPSKLTGSESTASLAAVEVMQSPDTVATAAVVN